MSEAKIYAENPPESVTIPLKHPIIFGEKRIEELVVRPMTGRDQMLLTKDIAKQPLAAVGELAAYLTGQPSQVIAAITGQDLGALNKVVQRFFTDSQETGSDE